jgi:hypothetical protein
MNAAIIYDELARAVKANTMLEEALFRAHEKVRWNVKPWPLNLLKLPPTATEALSDLKDVHLIVFAIRPAQLLPTGLLDWLGQWAERRQVGEAALAVFNDGNGETPPTPAVFELAQFAERQGLNFIFHKRDFARGGSAAFVRDPHSHEGSPACTLEDIINEAIPQYLGAKKQGPVDALHSISPKASTGE